MAHNKIGSYFRFLLLPNVKYLLVFRATTDKELVIINEIKHRNYLLVFAIIPEILFLMEMLIHGFIDWVYYSFVDKTQRLLNNEVNLDASLKEIV